MFFTNITRGSTGGCDGITFRTIEALPQLYGENRTTTEQFSLIH